jgi:hypothetical protein
MVTAATHMWAQQSADVGVVGARITSPSDFIAVIGCGLAGWVYGHWAQVRNRPLRRRVVKNRYSRTNN